MAFHYIAYGLCIRSEFSFPDLPSGYRSADLEIDLGIVDKTFLPLPSNLVSIFKSGSDIIHYYPNIGTFRVSMGRKIVVDPFPNVDMRILRSILLGNIMCTLLHQRGLLTLHGSAIALNGNAVAFLGPSGSGKSSTIAALMRQGYTGIADDVVAIDPRDRKPIIFPAFPQIKLPQDVANLLGYDQTKLSYISPKEKKYNIELAHISPLQVLPIRRIYLLEKGNIMHIQRLKMHESMIKLVSNSRAVNSLRAGEKIKLHFIQCAKVAKSIPVCRLVRSSNLNLISDFIKMVSHDLQICDDQEQ